MERVLGGCADLGKLGGPGIPRETSRAPGAGGRRLLLQAAFPYLTNQRAREVLASWMGSFNQRHPLDPHGVGPSRGGV